MVVVGETTDRRRRVGDRDDEPTPLTQVLPLAPRRDGAAPTVGAEGTEATITATGAATSLAGALRSEEMGRVRLFARLTLLLCVFGLALAPVYPGDPVAKRVLVVALVIAAGTSSFVEWMTRRATRYTDLRLFVAVQIQEVCATGAAYFFGVFSPFPAVVSLGIYVYSLGASFGNALACYVNLAVGQAVLSSLIIAGVVADRGMIHADYLGVGGQLLVQSNIQFVYLLAFVLGRMSRRNTVSAVEDLEAAIRAVAQREALFDEARQELERAARPGGPGRFTDQRLGGYQLGEVIGRGAMGEVYRAAHVETGAPAAVKLLQRSVLGDEVHVARFAREARIAASLDTPHVVRVLEVGERPLPYIAMELLDGDDLAKVLRDRRTLPLDETVALVGDVARGLAAAHAAGVVHRDVKPQNVFRASTADGPRWKVLDFGVSKLADEGAALTRGAILGTPAYMAPEQAAGRDVDRRADLYGLAVVAYRCLTGMPAFTGDDPHAILLAVTQHTPRRPGDLVALPADVDAWFAVALAKRRDERFADAPALADAFAAAARGELEPALRDRAAALLERYPWASTRRRRSTRLLAP